MNTITTTMNATLGRSGLFGVLIALAIGVTFAFASGLATPQPANAYISGYGDCYDCGGWEEGYDTYIPYDDYDYSWDQGYDTYIPYDDYDYSWDEGYDTYIPYDDYDYYYDDSYYAYSDYYVYEYEDYYYSDYGSYEYDWYYDYEYDYGCHSGCNPPQYDYCSNIPGNQPSGYDCYPDHGCNSGCNPPHDECSNIPGNQPDGYDCHPTYDHEPVCALSAEDYSIEEGDSTELHWTSEHATSATLTSFGSVSTGGNRTVSPTSDKTYTLTVKDNDGDTDTCSVTIRVEEEEDEDDLSCDLNVSETRVEEGDEVTLEWDIDGNATYASINQGVGRVDEDGGEEDVEVDRDTTFRLTVRDNDGDEETCSATVRVDEENDFSSIDFEGGPVNNPPVVYLSSLPYTGIEDITPSMWGFIITLFGLVGFGSYYVFVKRRQTA